MSKPCPSRALWRGAPARLRLVHVATVPTAAPLSLAGLPIIDEELHTLGNVHARAYLEGLRDRLVAESDLRITPLVLEPADADVRDQTIPQLLVRYAGTTDTDLIVMTSHGRGGWTRFWLGSVADALARSSPIPLLLLRSERDATLMEHSQAFRQILIPLDGSLLAEQMVAPAQAFGDLTHAEYILLHIVEPHLFVRSGPFTAPVDMDAEDTQQRQRAAQHYLEHIAQPLRKAGMTVRVDVRVAELVATAILDAVYDHHVDLVAIATHGRSGFRRLRMGSVADKVVRGAEQPVLLYRPSRREGKHTGTNTTQNS